MGQTLCRLNRAEQALCEEYKNTRIQLCKSLWIIEIFKFSMKHRKWKEKEIRFINVNVYVNVNVNVNVNACEDVKLQCQFK